MGKKITITVPEDFIPDLEELALEEKGAEEEVILNALKRRIFRRRFRAVAAKMSARSEELGIHSDQDVFDRVS